jgi:CRISPR-associated Cas5-like protein
MKTQMKALLLNVKFSEAHFKVHYTETTRLSYPSPLPPTVAGIFGAMLGWERNEYPKGIYCGARLISGGAVFTEAASYIQYGENKYVRGVASIEVLYAPEYVIAIASDDAGMVQKWAEKLSSGFERLPYGGQNDFFIDGADILKTDEVTWSDRVGGYAPSSWIKRVDGEATILPVMYEGMRIPFTFAYAGTTIYVDREIPSVSGVPLYPLSGFSSLGDTSSSGEDYTQLLNNFVSKYRLVAGKNLQTIASQYRTGKWGELRRMAAKGDAAAIHTFIDMLVEKAVKDREYSATIVPTMLSSSVARNMKVVEGEVPTPESVHYWLYLQLSAIPVSNTLLNMLYVGEEFRNSFFTSLIDEEALREGRTRVRMDEIKRVLGPMGRSFPLDFEFCATFAVLNYFCYWLKKERIPLERLGVSDLSTLVVITVPQRGVRGRKGAVREVKRSMYFISRLSSYIQRWYGDYFTSDEEYPPLGRFISSLYEPNDDYSAYLLNKFLYDFLRNRVNSHLLLELVRRRADRIFAGERTIPILEARYFFSRLSSESFV